MDTAHPGYMCHLKKSLYSLKQAPLAWNRTLNAFLHELGFISAKADPCIYSLHLNRDNNHGGDGKQHALYAIVAGVDSIYISMYVNDMLIMGAIAAMQVVKAKLSAHFHIKDMGPVCTILGLHVMYNHAAGTLDLHQPLHIKDLLSTFGLVNCWPVSTPLPTSLNLAIITSTPASCLQLTYHKAMGKLLYIAVASRPDIHHDISEQVHVCIQQHTLHHNYLHRRASLMAVTLPVSGGSIIH